MPDIPNRILEQNPWWGDPDAIGRDPVLMRLQRAPFHYRPPVVRDLDLSGSAVYTLRGPRRVGKSTVLKLLAERAIQTGRANRLLYYSFDLETDFLTLVEVYRMARELRSRMGSGPWLVLFDEVTAVPEWQRGVKYLRDQTEAADDCLILTGSSARDLRTAGERLPGRRGRIVQPDRLLLPLSFREFCIAVGTGPGVGPLTFHDLLHDPEGMVVREGLPFLRELQELLSAYLMVGGFPEAVADHVRGGTVEDTTVRTLWEVAAGDLARWGRDRLTAYKLLERIVRSLGSRFSWHTLAGELDIVSHETARQYVEILADSYLLLVLHHWDTGGGRISPRKQKKLYLADTLLGSVPALIQPGAPRPELPALVENTVALTLYRSLEIEPVESFGLPGSLFYWRSSSGTEIDFLVGSGNMKIPVEVAWRHRVGKERTITSMERHFGRGIIVTRGTTELQGPVRQIPAALFCYLLDRSGTGQSATVTGSEPLMV